MSYILCKDTTETLTLQRQKHIGTSDGDTPLPPQLVPLTTKTVIAIHYLVLVIKAL